MHSNSNKLKVNKRRLTKKLVEQEISNGSKLREDLSNLFSKAISFGDQIEKPQIYELETGNFLFVFDEHDISIAGKGDIYTPEIFQKIIKRYKRHLADRDKRLGSSADMWKYFSKIGNELIHKVENLKNELVKELEIEEQNLDYTYKSLDLINEKLLVFEIEEIRVRFYDHLIAYIGEVIRRRVDGEWKLNKKNDGGNYPYIDIGVKECKLMPLNVLVTEFSKILDLNLRQATTNEIRANSYYIRMK